MARGKNRLLNCDVLYVDSLYTQMGQGQYDPQDHAANCTIYHLMEGQFRKMIEHSTTCLTTNLL